jgi:hypothetical protein
MEPEFRVARLAAPLGTAHAPSPDVRYGPPGLFSLDAYFAPPSVAALVSNAGSRSTGSPSQPPVAQVVNLCVFPLRIRSTAAVLVVKGCMVLIMLPKKTFPGGKKVTE